MKLYDIDEKILACVDQETGEIIDEEALAGLQLEKDRKIEGIACWVKDLTAEAKALKEEADNLKKRQKAAENKAESLKKFLLGYLGGQKFKTAKASISYHHTKAVDILDEASIPEEYLRIKKELSKSDISKALKEGKEVPGAELVERTSVTSR